LDGVLGQIKNNGFTVERADWDKVYENLNQTEWQTHRLDDFLYLARTYNWYSVSMNCWIHTVYWEPHYSDEYPFYSIFFSNGTTVFIYTYSPNRGTGDM
jgi:hypothetical protein